MIGYLRLLLMVLSGALYEKYGLNSRHCYVLNMPAYVDCGGEIYFVDMLCVISCSHNGLSCHKFAEVI